LTPDSEVLVARDADEVVEHLKSLDEERARRIGEAALQRVLAEHTYRHRALEFQELFVGAFG
jgi:spore maturation protein CgeB